MYVNEIRDFLVCSLCSCKIISIITSGNVKQIIDPLVLLNTTKNDGGGCLQTTQYTYQTDFLQIILSK